MKGILYEKPRQIYVRDVRVNAWVPARRPDDSGGTRRTP